MAVLILTEGTDDCHTIQKLIVAAGAGTARFHREWSDEHADFVLKGLGGYPKLRKSFEADLAGEISHVAIVADLDNSTDNRWKSLIDKLKELQGPVGYLLPEIASDPSSGGDIFHAGNRVIGIWLWPDHQSEGDMETFAAKLIPEGDDLWPLADSTVEALPERRFKKSYLPKAKIHTWLAWQNEPGQQIGEAIRDHKLKYSEDTAQAFLAWLAKLRDTPL